MSKVTDSQLIARFLAGDKRAFEEIVQRNTPWLRAHLTRFLFQLEPDVRNAAIDDVLQEVWIRLTRHAALLDPQRKLSTWLFTVASNLARDEHQRRARSGVRWPLIVDPDTGVSVELDVEDPSALSRPDVLCEDRDMLAKLAGYMQQNVPRAYLEVLELREVHGYSYAEIAARRGIRIATVRNYLHRARKVARQFRDANK